MIIIVDATTPYRISVATLQQQGYSEDTPLQFSQIGQDQRAEFVNNEDLENPDIGCNAGSHAVLTERFACLGNYRQNLFFIRLGERMAGLDVTHPHNPFMSVKHSVYHIGRRRWQLKQGE